MSVRLFADFETVTTNTQYYKKHQDTRILLFCIMNKKCEIVGEGVNFKEFLECLKNIDCKTSINIYFHNLNFDGDFILKGLVANGFCANNLRKNGYTLNEKYKLPNTFTFMRQARQIYNIELWMINNFNNNIKINFLCSLKKLSAGIEALGKSLGIDKYKNVEDKIKFYDVEPTIFSKLPKKFINYCRRDVEILVKSFNQFENNLKQFFKENLHVKPFNVDEFLTIGAMAYQIQEEFILKYCYEKMDMEIHKGIKITNKTHQLASYFYFGGITQFNPKHQGQNLMGKFIKIDINSAHPSSMCELLPYGELYNFKDQTPQEGKKYLEYWEIKVDLAINKTGDFINLANWVKINNRINKNNPNYKKQLETKNRYCEMLMNFNCFYLKEEFEILKNFYNFEGIKIVNRWWAYADYFLKDYVKSIYKYKEHYARKKDKANAQTYKILLNSSYGKHATRADFGEIYICSSKNEYEEILKMGEIEIYKRKWEVKEVSEFIKLDNHYFLSLVPIDENQKPLFNKLIAATICAWTRIKIYKTILKLGVENFIYCDTDAIIFKYFDGWDKLVELDNYELGKWALEQETNQVKVKGAKNYMVMVDGQPKYTMSGVSGSFISSNMNLELYEKDDIFYKDANIYIKSCKSGLVLLKRDYIPKPRTL